ncbi:MAG: class A beta-lactamase-related serine hydrolase [Actinobacteria bacterium]|nr:class A beta-lactamase-related serine hydrolase [Actinomycetota bacterium]
MCMKYLRKSLRVLVIGVVAIFALLWIGTAAIRYPNPISAARLGLAMPSATVKLLPANAIKATRPLALADGPKDAMPSTVRWSNQQIDIPSATNTAAKPTEKTLSEFLSSTKTNAFLVVRNGKITYEWYGKGFSKDSLLPSYSVAKSVVGILAGQAIAAGKLKESDTFVSFFPEFKTGTDFDKVTLRDLLDMKGGVGVADDYPTGPSGWLVPIARMYATTDLMYFIKGHRSMFYPPGTKAEYRSVDAQLAGMMVRKAMGMSLADMMQEKVFPQIGAEHDGSWSADHKGGIEKSFCCMNLTARDYAKLGMLFVNGGKGPNGQVIDPTWFKRLTVPSVRNFGDNKWGYGAFVWHPTDRTSFFTGLNGQYVLANPATKTVIVKLSDDTVGGVTMQTYNVMWQLATIGSIQDINTHVDVAAP